MKNFVRIFNLLLVLVLAFGFNLKASAIDWVEVSVKAPKVAYIDKDSITKTDKYYFYNIKYKNFPKEKFTILTIQSAHQNSYAGRLKVYSEAEYEKLKGDYENITKLATDNLEPAQFGSIVHSCHKMVRELMSEKAKPTIIFE